MKEHEFKHLKEAESIIRRWKKVRAIILKRKSSFTVYEWMEIENLIKTVE